MLSHPKAAYWSFGTSGSVNITFGNYCFHIVLSWYGTSSSAEPFTSWQIRFSSNGEWIKYDIFIFHYFIFLPVFPSSIVEFFIWADILVQVSSSVAHCVLMLILFFCRSVDFLKPLGYLLYASWTLSRRGRQYVMESKLVRQEIYMRLIYKKCIFFILHHVGGSVLLTVRTTVVSRFWQYEVLAAKVTDGCPRSRAPLLVPTLWWLTLKGYWSTGDNSLFGYNNMHCSLTE